MQALALTAATNQGSHKYAVACVQHKSGHNKFGSDTMMVAKTTVLVWVSLLSHMNGCRPAKSEDSPLRLARMLPRLMQDTKFQDITLLNLETSVSWPHSHVSVLELSWQAHGDAVHRWSKAAALIMLNSSSGSPSCGGMATTRRVQHDERNRLGPQVHCATLPGDFYFPHKTLANLQGWQLHRPHLPNTAIRPSGLAIHMQQVARHTDC